MERPAHLVLRRPRRPSLWCWLPGIHLSITILMKKEAYIENILLNGEGVLDQSLLGIVFISPGVLLPLIQFSRKFPRLLLQDQKRHLAARLLTFPRLSMEKPELSTVQKVICRYARNLKVIRESLIICNHYPPILQVVTTCQRGRSGCGLCS